MAEPFVEIRSSPESLREHFLKLPCSTDLLLGVGKSSLVGELLVGPSAEPTGKMASTLAEGQATLTLPRGVRSLQLHLNCNASIALQNGSINTASVRATTEDGNPW
jgi:hypothetical protein